MKVVRKTYFNILGKKRQFSSTATFGCGGAAMGPLCLCERLKII